MAQVFQHPGLFFWQLYTDHAEPKINRKIEKKKKKIQKLKRTGSVKKRWKKGTRKNAGKKKVKKMYIHLCFLFFFFFGLIVLP